MSIYREELLLRSKDVDLHRRLRTSRLFELLQEASIRHTEQLGMGREKTLDKGILWVVGLQRAEITRMPVYDEQIVLKSWPGETMHFFFPRYYQIETADGELLSVPAPYGRWWTANPQDGFSRAVRRCDRRCRTGEEIRVPSLPPVWS